MIVSLAHMGDGAELERAFSGASLLLVFNVSTVVILFPLELITGYLYELSKAMLPASVGQDEKWEGPIKKIVAPFANKIIMANSGLITDLANEDLKCEDKYPVLCFNSTDNRDLYISQQRNPIDFPDFNATNYDFGSPTFVGYDTCDAGLIGCNKKDGKCPVFFQEGASKQDDITAGWVCLIMSLFLLIICLILLVALLKKILLGASTRIIYKATNINGYVSVVIGAAVTVLVQSSSITASSLTPLAGIGVLKVEQMYPLIIGADIGTCITALLASLVSSKVDALQVALCHLFFNITGAIIWYVVPPVRRVPLFFARYLGKVTRKWRQFPIVFIIICFFILPILILGISTCFEKGSRGYQALGIFLTLLIFAVIFYAFIWWRYKGGKSTFRSWIRERKRKEAALKALADDMDYIKVDLEYCKNEIIRLKDFAGVVSANENFHYGPLGQGTDGDEFELPPEETLDGRKSIHGSVSTKNWAGVLADAGVSIKGSLASMKL
jgi:sodium-dependent phosphate cotransporter